MNERMLIAASLADAVEIAARARRLGIEPVFAYEARGLESSLLARAAAAYAFPSNQSTAALAASVLAIARRIGARLVHPGFGRLAVSDELQALATESGVVSIGQLSRRIDSAGEALSEAHAAWDQTCERRIELPFALTSGTFAWIGPPVDTTLARRGRPLLIEAPAAVSAVALSAMRSSVERLLARERFPLHGNGIGAAIFGLAQRPRLLGVLPTPGRAVPAVGGLGIDMIELQLRLAIGEQWPELSRSTQTDAPHGVHALAARLHAEDPARGFVKTPGLANGLRWPEQAEVQAAIVEGEMTPFDGSPLATIVANGRGRASAADKLRAAIEQFQVDVTTTRPLLLEVLAAPHDLTTPILPGELAAIADGIDPKALGDQRAAADLFETTVFVDGRQVRVRLGRDGQAALAAVFD